MRNTTLTELYLGDTLGWVDVTDDARQGVADSGGAHTITRREADPGTMDLVLANPGGRYSPRNPRSEYFGLLGRNTPVRFGVELLTDGFDDRTSASGWGTGWSWFGAGGTVAGTDHTVSSGAGRHFVPTTNAYRGTYYSARSFRDAEVRVTVDMLITDVTGGAIEPANLLFRLQDINTYYMARVEVSAAEVVSVSLHHSTGGPIIPSTAVDGLTFTGQPLQVAASCVGDRLAIKVWDPAAGGEPRDWQLTATDTRLTQAGHIGVRSGVASGNSNTKPIEFVYDNLRVIDRRAHMEVSSWPPRWNTAGTDTWVPLQAAGILRRLGQGTKPPDSALYRYLSRQSPTAYWPLEDPAGSLAARSDVAGVEPLTTFGFSRFTAPGTGEPVPAANLPVFASGEGIPGSGPVVDLAQGGVLQGAVPAGTSAGWNIQFVIRAPRDKGATVTILRFATNGTYGTWDFTIEATGIFSLVYTGDPLAGGVGSASASLNLFDGLPHHVQIEAFDSGGNVVAAVYVDDVFVDTYSAFSPPLAGTAGSITHVTVNPLEYTADEAEAQSLPILGHLAVWNPSAGLTDSTWAMLGHPGETAADRIERLCAEQGVTVLVTGGPDDSAAMGPQRPAPFLDLLRECADADGGILGEAREQLALTYRCLGVLYNRTPLELDYTHLAPPLEPTDDDEQVRNDVTASRPDGGTARSVQETGPLSVLDPPDGVGVYDTAVTVNVAADVQLPDQASWRRHVGTWDEARYPRARVELAAPHWEAAPDLAAEVSALDDGDVVALDGLPDWLPPGPVLSMVRGSVERVDEFARSIDWTWTPAGPYTVAEADGDPRVPADGSTLAADLTGDVTTLNSWDFTTDVEGWTALAGTGTATHDAANQAVDFTPTGSSSSLDVRSPNTPGVAPGDVLAFTTTVSCATARDVGLGIIWRDSGGTLLSLTFVTVTLTAADTPTTVTMTGTAPANTTQVTAQIALGSTPPASDVLTVYSAELVTAATLQLASTTENGVWTTDVNQFPQDLRVGGERVTASAISGTSSPQTVTLSARAVNGVQADWPAGTEVDVWVPAIAPL